MVVATQTVAEIAVNVPGASRIFASHRIDYCGGGKKTLREACEHARVPVDRVIADLSALGPTELGSWASLTTLISHIIDRHHVYAREAMAHIAPLTEKVRNVHGARHHELVHVCELFHRLCADLSPHMRSEEETLFPAIVERARPDCSPARREGLRMSMLVMQHDHEGVGELLEELREITSNYEPPEDACTSYRALYRELEALESNLYEHIHLENNVLMPRALHAEPSSTT